MRITITSYYLHRTYGGILEGLPKDPVAWAHDRARKLIEKMWGKDRPILVLNAPTKEVHSMINGNVQMLPPWQYMAWMTGPAVEKDDDGTHLVVIGYLSEPILDILGIIAQVDWKKHAVGFGY